MQPAPEGQRFPAWQRWSCRLLRAAAWLLILLAAVAALTGGAHARIGPLELSATHPARLLVEAFVLFITAHLVSIASWGTERAAGPATLALVLGLLVALTFDSTPRRVGDGGEYLAMAYQVAHLRPPAMSSDDLDRFKRESRAGESFQVTQLQTGLKGHDGRYDFVHFWFYSLLAAPLVRAAGLLGAHPNTGFTVLNLLLLAVAGGVLARRVSAALLTVILTGPFVWWLDKAHTEVLSVAALTVAVVLIEEKPWWAVIALAVAGTQNPAIGVAGLIFAASAAIRGAWRDRRFLVAIAIAGAISALHPLYYLWHLGRLSPLESAVTRAIPGITALVSPLLDPNIGILVYCPAFTLLAIWGVAAALRRRRLPAGATSVVWPVLLSAGVFVLAFAQTPNVNHGGTFNPSRYGLWLLPLGIPLLRVGERDLGRARSIVMTALAVLATAWGCYMFAPRWPDNAADPTTAARLLYAHAPSWYNPLPEVFAERQAGREDTALPLAAASCTKVLLAGDGTTRPPWPIPCVPQDVPAECRPVGALCYANRQTGAYSFTVAPRQAGFGYQRPAGGTWKDTGDRRIRRLLERLGTSALDPLPAGKPRSFIAQALRLPWSYAWQGDSALIAWLAPNTTDSKLRLNVPSRGVAVWIDAESGNDIGSVDLPPRHDVWVSVPDVAAVLLVKLERAQGGR